MCAIALTVVSGQRRVISRVTPGRQTTVLTVSNVNRPLAPTPLSPEDEAPKPYSFAYEATDDTTGANSKREESSDGRTTRGSYSYIDADGVFRVVEYTADENGFNANVRTNEPGTAAATGDIPDPANTVFAVEPPPPEVAARYATAESARAAASARRSRRFV